MTTELDSHFLPGVSFTVDGEALPAQQVCWAMYSSCGCVAGVHMMTEDTVTERDAWKAMSGNARMVKRDRDRGFTIKMAKLADVDFGERCAHTPQWGYVKPPKPDGYSWAVSFTGRTLHLVPLVEAEDGAGFEWVQGADWKAKATSLCGRVTESVRGWSRKWYRTDGKVECAGCLKIAEGQVSA